MGYRIERGSVMDKQDAVWHLLVAHRDELTTNKDLMVLAPDWPRYKLMEDAGMLITLFAYDDDDKIVGYSCNLVGQNLHYVDLRYAHNDVLYVDPDHRGRLGLKLIRETEKAAAEAGARMMIWHAKEHTPLKAIMPRLGYRVQDTLYSKELQNGI